MKFEFVRSVKICLPKENAHEFSTTGAMKSMAQSRVLKKQIPLRTFDLSKFGACKCVCVFELFDTELTNGGTVVLISKQ